MRTPNQEFQSPPAQMAILLIALGLTSCSGQPVIIESRMPPSAPPALLPPPTMPKKQASVFETRDLYFKSVGDFTTFGSSELGADHALKPGWYPFGYGRTDEPLFAIKKAWAKNLPEYALIDGLAPNHTSCFGLNVFQCIRNMSESLIVTTYRTDKASFQHIQRDVNGDLVDSIAQTDILVRVPEANAAGVFKKITLHYQLSSGIVKTVDIGRLPRTNISCYSHFRAKAISKIHSSIRL